MIISIERERDTPTPGKSPRYRARIKETAEGHAVLISAHNFGSITAAKDAMDDFFGRLLDVRDAGGLRRALHWRDSNDPETRATAELTASEEGWTVKL